MSDFKLTVGLEIHAELKTQTKMFCACRNDANERQPNVHICPVCMAHPGTLPVINKEAVRNVLLVGAAVGGELADYTEFDRKNYFYPDIPKGYQISQFAHPLVKGGSLAGITLTRIHLEEDTARSQHQGEVSLVDYNRAGVPLMELVTEPDIHSAEDAGRFARELQLLLRYLGAGEANMEKGEMRVEANISVSRDETLGTKVEVKNLNSFRSVERAIAYELKRQAELIDSGGAVVQETRGWDEATQRTFSQRKKESSHDYRYFPDPDLPKLIVSEVPEFSKEALVEDLRELPWVRRERYLNLGLSPEQAEIFVQNEFQNTLFGAVANSAQGDKELLKLATNYITSDLAGLMSNPSIEGNINRITSDGFIDLMRMIKDGKLSSRGAKDALADWYANGGDINDIAAKFVQQSDSGALEAIAKEVAAANPGPSADYKSGKEAALQFLVGQGMKLSKGSANPQALREAIQRVLG